MYSSFVTKIFSLEKQYKCYYIQAHWNYTTLQKLSVQTLQHTGHHIITSTVPQCLLKKSFQMYIFHIETVYTLIHKITGTLGIHWRKKSYSDFLYLVPLLRRPEFCSGSGPRFSNLSKIVSPSDPVKELTSGLFGVVFFLRQTFFLQQYL